MGLFDFLRGPDIRQGVEEWKKTPGAVLLDVRTPGEYGQGHIPGSINIPLDGINQASARIPDKSTPLFVYCRSGARSGRVVASLKRMGYKESRNIGGINGYRGKLER